MYSLYRLRRIPTLTLATFCEGQMVNIFVLIVLFGGSIDHVQFPYRAECDYAAKKINEAVAGAQAFCFDVRVAGDRHENSFTQQP